MENILGLSADGISARTGIAESYRGRQIAEWIYRKGAMNFNEMTNLPKALRANLSENFSITRAKMIARQDSFAGDTTKFLLEFYDGTAVESVLMRHEYGNSICLSTQAGCAMGCAFCASTLGGLSRSLTSGEIFSEALFIEELLRRENKKIDSVVLMGSGEPLMNYENVLSFIRLIHEPYALGMSFRSITLSTSGIAPGIDRLASEGLPLTLSISLHAPNDEIRSRIMPVNKKWNIADVTDAGNRYADMTGRRVTYEYILIGGVNDSPENARELASLMRGRLANVNLIPVNPVAERGFSRPKSPGEFLKILIRLGVNATLRREMGADIDAACGQLRNRMKGVQNGAA